MATQADWKKIEAQGEVHVSPSFLHDQFTGEMKGDSPADRRVLSAITGWGSYRLEESDAILEQLGEEGLGLAEVGIPEDWSNIQLGYFDDIAANPVGETMSLPEFKELFANRVWAPGTRFKLRLEKYIRPMQIIGEPDMPDARGKFVQLRPEGIRHPGLDLLMPIKEAYEAFSYLYAGLSADKAEKIYENRHAIATNPVGAPHLGVHPLDYTPEQMEDVIVWFATLPEKELRRRQTINIKQTEYVLKQLRKHPFWEKIQRGEYHTQLSQGLETLDIMARLLQEAMLTKV